MNDNMHSPIDDYANMNPKPEVSTGQGFLSCPALSCFLPSFWWATGQDKNKKRVLSYRTGHQDRLSCAQLCPKLTYVRFHKHLKHILI